MGVAAISMDEVSPKPLKQYETPDGQIFYVDESVGGIQGLLSDLVGAPVSQNKTKIEDILPQYRNMFISESGMSSARAGELSRAKYDYTKGLIEPLEDKLFGVLPYNNPELEQQYKNKAFNTISNDFNQERGIIGRQQAATGDVLSKDIESLQTSILNLGKQESIAKAAGSIKQRLKDRELQATLGLGQSIQSGVK